MEPENRSSYKDKQNAPRRYRLFVCAICMKGGGTLIKKTLTLKKHKPHPFEYLTHNPCLKDLPK